MRNVHTDSADLCTRKSGTCRQILADLMMALKSSVTLYARPSVKPKS